MNCLDFLRLRQEMGEIDASINLSDENIVLEDWLPVHRDLWSLMMQHAISTGQIVGNITSSVAVIAWIDSDGKVHSSNTDNHFIEKDK